MQSSCLEQVFLPVTIAPPSCCGTLHPLSRPSPRSISGTIALLDDPLQTSVCPSGDHFLCRWPQTRCSGEKGHGVDLRECEPRTAVPHLVRALYKVRQAPSVSRALSSRDRSQKARQRDRDTSTLSPIVLHLCRQGIQQVTGPTQ